MRITCEQCGQTMNTINCRRFCDEKKKEIQLEKIEAELKDLTSQINGERKDL